MVYKQLKIFFFSHSVSDLFNFFTRYGVWVCTTITILAPSPCLVSLMASWMCQLVYNNDHYSFLPVKYRPFHSYSLVSHWHVAQCSTKPKLLASHLSHSQWFNTLLLFMGLEWSLRISLGLSSSSTPFWHPWSLYNLCSSSWCQVINSSVYHYQWRFARWLQNPVYSYGFLSYFCSRETAHFPVVLMSPAEFSFPFLFLMWSHQWWLYNFPKLQHLRLNFSMLNLSPQNFSEHLDTKGSIFLIMKLMNNRQCYQCKMIFDHFLNCSSFSVFGTRI